jgi:hypothetical protein
MNNNSNMKRKFDNYEDARINELDDEISLIEDELIKKSVIDVIKKRSPSPNIVESNKRVKYYNYNDGNFLRLSQEASYQIYKSKKLRELLLQIPNFCNNVIINLKDCDNVTDISRLSGFCIIDVCNCDNLITINNVNNVKYIIARDCKNLIDVYNLNVSALDLSNSNVNIIYKVNVKNAIVVNNCNNLDIIATVNTNCYFAFHTKKHLKLKCNLSILKTDYHIETEEDLILYQMSKFYPSFNKISNNQLEEIKLSKELSLEIYRSDKLLNKLLNIPTICNYLILDLHEEDEVTSISKFSGFNGINVSGCKNLEKISNIKNINYLYAVGCTNLKIINNVQINSMLILNESNIESIENVKVNYKIVMKNCLIIKEIINVYAYQIDINNYENIKVIDSNINIIVNL